MDAIQKQVIYDEKNNPIGVVIPIAEWNRIEAKLSPKVKGSSIAKLMKHFGKIPFPGDPVKIQRQLRSEWPD